MVHTIEELAGLPQGERPQESLSDKDRALAIIYTIHQAQSLEEAFHSIQQPFIDLVDAVQILLLAVDREKREFFVLHTFGPCDALQTIRVSISNDPFFGYAARRGRILNLANVYDNTELSTISANLAFDPTWDQKTAWHTTQALVLPLLAERKYLVGILAFFNNRVGERFSAAAEEFAKDIAEALSNAMHTQFHSMLRQAQTIDTAPTANHTGTYSLQQPEHVVTPQHMSGEKALFQSDDRVITQSQEMAFLNDELPRKGHRKEALRLPVGQRAFGRFESLLEQQLITSENLQIAMNDARHRHVDVETLLLDQYGIPKKELGQSLSRFYGCPFLEFDERAVLDRSLLKGLNFDYLKTNYWVPIRRSDDSVDILVDNPRDMQKIEHIQLLMPGCKLNLSVGLRQDIVQYLHGLSGKQVEMGSIQDILGDLSDAQVVSDEEDDSIVVHEDDSAIVRLVNQIIVDAYKRDASDIHIEPYAARVDTVVRFRIDGSCLEYQRVPPGYRRALVSRIKIMARLDIAERRKPQDGKIKFRLPNNRDIELRVATIPTSGGDEDVVMRLLAASEPMPLEALQMTARNLSELRRLLDLPYGLLLVVGPTGSGKTTTLHAALGSINTSEVKIWTAEDPVEITQYGLRQVQVQPRIGFTFAAAMRSFLRADPDVIMVGEMRDEETAHMGIEASLTGHLVLSTLHTNSAPETVTRLLDMGLDPFNFADALLGVLAQRLARTLCKACKEPYTPAAEHLEELRRAYGVEAFDALAVGAAATLTLYRAKGCDLCSNLGYKGRVGLHELLVGSDELKRLIQTRARITDVNACAQREGMTTLLQDGILKILNGVTDFAQVRAVASK